MKYFVETALLVLTVTFSSCEALSVHKSEGKGYFTDPESHLFRKKREVVVPVTLDVQQNNGLMFRASMLENMAKVAGVNVESKLSLDTGVNFDGGVEVKFFGMGLTAKKDQAEICFIFCVGVIW